MMNSFGQGSVLILSEEEVLRMLVISESFSVCVETKLESRSLNSVGTLSINSKITL